MHIPASKETIKAITIRRVSDKSRVTVLHVASEQFGLISGWSPMEEPSVSIVSADKLWGRVGGSVSKPMVLNLYFQSEKAAKQMYEWKLKKLKSKGAPLIFKK